HRLRPVLSFFPLSASLALFGENRDACSRRSIESFTEPEDHSPTPHMTRSRPPLFCIFFLLFLGVSSASADDISNISPTGYGTEPIINDARAGDVGRAMVPFLRQNDFGSAVEVAAWQLAKYIADDRGVTLSGQPPARPIANTSRGRGLPISPFVFFIILFI